MKLLIQNGLMYKAILLTLLISTKVSSQNTANQTTVVDISNSKSPIELANSAAKEQGFYSLGNGIYKVVQVGGSGFVKLTTLRKRVEEQINVFAKSNNLTFQVLNIEEQKQSIGVFPKVSVTYQMFDASGKKYLSSDDKLNLKNSIIKELKQLKELLDLGIISKEEHEKKSTVLKNTLLEL